MINSIVTTGKYIQNWISSNPPYINISNASAGMLRMNGSILEVYDGFTWVQVSTQATVGLSPEAEALLDWAKGKKEEEERLNSLCENYPALAKARENFNTIKHIVDSEIYD